MPGDERDEPPCNTFVAQCPWAAKSQLWCHSYYFLLLISHGVLVNLNVQLRPISGRAESISGC
eukprot:361510-Chlamydomonas_euryale.AAC.2